MDSGALMDFGAGKIAPSTAGIDNNGLDPGHAEALGEGRSSVGADPAATPPYQGQ